MKLEDLNFCITSPNSFGLWNLYPTQEKADAELARLRQEQPEKFGNSRVMLFDDWQNSKENSYLSEPLREIDEEAYWYALEVLPPMQWHTYEGVNVFCMMEFTDGSITQQYGLIKRDGVERYFTKPVRFNDRATYITRALIDMFDASKVEG